MLTTSKTSSLTHFHIEKLHGERTYSIPIKDNCLILVGKNGLGKSTVLNIMFFTLTCQWHRLAEINFNSIILTINDTELTIKHEDLESYISHRDSFMNRSMANRRIKNIIDSLTSQHDVDRLLTNRDLLWTLSNELEVPMHILRENLREYNKSKNLFTATIDDTENSIKSCVLSKILYLPTYRRIEQDLESIFRGRETPVIKQLRERLTQRVQSERYVEFLEFGMEDVIGIISDKMTSLKDNARADLNDLTGRYLSDIIRESYKNQVLEILTN